MFKRRSYFEYLFVVCIAIPKGYVAPLVQCALQCTKGYVSSAKKGYVSSAPLVVLLLAAVVQSTLYLAFDL
eukprot:580871-Rhodomonas_salina.1